MDRFEEAVMEYISANPDCLLKTQLSLPWDQDKGIGGSLPDFVVLNFREKTVYIVEVTTASSIRGILHKVSERKSRWYDPIKNYDAAWTKLIGDWEFRVCLFLRDQVVSKVRVKISGYEDVSVISLNKVMNPWDWEWSSNNIPNNPLKTEV